MPGLGPLVGRPVGDVVAPEAIVPPVTSYSGEPISVAARVLLPEPLGPMMAWTSPAPTVRSRPFRIGRAQAGRRTAASMHRRRPQSLDRGTAHDPVYGGRAFPTPVVEIHAVPMSDPHHSPIWAGVLQRWDGSPVGATVGVSRRSSFQVRKRSWRSPRRPGAVGPRRRGTGGRCGRADGRRPGPPSSGRRRRRPARPATAARGRCGACIGGRSAAGRSSPRASSRAVPRPTPSPGCCGRGSAWPAGRRCAPGCVSSGRSSDAASHVRRRRVTSRGRPTPARCGRSAPMVVSTPWPGSTTVVSGNVNSRVSIDWMIVAKSPPSKLVLPGPPGNSVSPVNSSGVPAHVEARSTRACGPGCGWRRGGARRPRSPRRRRGRRRSRRPAAWARRAAVTATS